MSNSTAVAGDEDECGVWMAGWGCSVAIFLSLPIIFSLIEYLELLDWLKLPVHKKAYVNWCERIMKCTFSEDNDIAYGTSTCLPKILSPDNYMPPIRRGGNVVIPTDENGHYKFFHATPEFKVSSDRWSSSSSSSLSSPSLSTYYKNLFTASFFNYSWTDTS